MRLIKIRKNTSDDNASAVSDLSHDEINSPSPSNVKRRFRGLGKKKDSIDGPGSVGSQSTISKISLNRTGKNVTQRKDQPKQSSVQVTSSSPDLSTSAPQSTIGIDKAHSAEANIKKLAKDSKSRCNIGLVYLKTGDYVKAKENLEESLYWSIQLHGEDVMTYSNEAILQIAQVREKLGDCYLANSAIMDKPLALAHYKEGKRLLKSVAQEDSSDEILEMSDIIDEKLKSPELQDVQSSNLTESKFLPPSHMSSTNIRKENTMNKYSKSAVPMTGKAAKVLGPNEVPVSKIVEGGNDSLITSIGMGIGKGVGKIGKGVIGFAGDLLDDIEETRHLIHESAKSVLWVADIEVFEVSMQHLERNNHRTALNHLSSLKESDGMKDEHFRSLLVDYIIKVADKSVKDKKIGIATDAYEQAIEVLRKEEGKERVLSLANRGCIKGHKLLAFEDEQNQEYEAAIQHRRRVYRLLLDEDKCVPACQQLLKVAYYYAEMSDYEKSADTLLEAKRQIFKGVRLVENMPKDRVPLLIRCCYMRALCFAKAKKWQQAYDQYDEILPLVYREEGESSKTFYSILVHKAALLVTMGKYGESINCLKKYIKDARNKEICLPVDDNDHILALDTYASAQMKMGNVDEAIEMFQLQLNKLQTMTKVDELKAKAMHNLGCLLANKKRHKEALPLLTKALDTRKFLYNGTNKYLFETTWAVATTSLAAGEKDKALKEYEHLLEKKSTVDEATFDWTSLHYAAGRLYFEGGKLDLAFSTFSDALRQAKESNESDTTKANIMLSMANVLSAQGDTDKASQLYDDITDMRSIKGTEEYYHALYNKSIILGSKGELEKARIILDDITLLPSTKVSDDIQGNVYLALGQIYILAGMLDEALKSYEKSIAFFSKDESEVKSLTQAKKFVGLAYFEMGQYDIAIEKLEDILDELSQKVSENKDVSLLKADIWSSMSRVYSKKGDVASAKNFEKLALQTFKAVLGEKHPMTLRHISNLAVILLEEAEDLPKSKAKVVIDAAKFEMEDALESFISLKDVWIYRVDVATLKTNLGFIAVWQGKPKKAKKILSQIKGMDIPRKHPLEQRIACLEESLQKLDQRALKA